MTRSPEHPPRPQAASSSHTSSPATYIWVFLALLVLLALTVLLAFHRVPEGSAARSLVTAAGYSIAIIKALLIILWFMHVKLGTRLTKIFASAAFVWLSLMIIGIGSDYITRSGMYPNDAPSAFKPPLELPPAGVAQEGRPLKFTKALADH